MQTDIKKVLAYSTVSQLGYMFMGAGVLAYGAGIFHLMTHAFFKGCLFLCSGAIIHGLGGEQDMRFMGGLRKYMPWTFWCMTSATFAIAGFPPFAAFFSKDAILGATFASGQHVLWLIGIIAAGMTSFYMFRLWFMTFFGEYRGPNPATAGHGHGDDHGHGTPHESPWVMVLPLVFLGSFRWSAAGLAYRRRSAAPTISSTSWIRCSRRMPPRHRPTAVTLRAKPSS